MIPDITGEQTIRERRVDRQTDERTNGHATIAVRNNPKQEEETIPDRIRRTDEQRKTDGQTDTHEEERWFTLIELESTISLPLPCAKASLALPIPWNPWFKTSHALASKPRTPWVYPSFVKPSIDEYLLDSDEAVWHRSAFSALSGSRTFCYGKNEQIQGYCFATKWKEDRWRDERDKWKKGILMVGWADERTESKGWTDRRKKRRKKG